MAKEQEPYLRIPPAVGDIQVNFCKNPACANFGVPADVGVQPTGSGASKRRRDRYVRSGEKGSRFLYCNACRETAPIKSNQGIAEELLRMRAYLAPHGDVVCKNPHCRNHGLSLSLHRDQYRASGFTAAGSQRFRCKGCGKMFSLPLAANLRQRKPDKGVEVFRFLVGKVPIRKIARLARVSYPTVYDKLRLIHRQCLLFAATREKSFPQRKVHRLYIAIDRQQHEVNWISQKDRRTTPLQAVASADCRTGYIFGVHVNYDPSMDSATIEADARACGDLSLDPPFRKYARLWLDCDYGKAANGKIPVRPGKVPLDAQVAGTYEDTGARDDVEVSDLPENGTRLPSKGMQVHSEYTLYGHFFFLRGLLAGAEKVRFYCDQESGLRAAVMAAFGDRILAKECDAFYIRIAKDLTNPQKLSMVSKSRRELEDFRRISTCYAELRDDDLRVIKATGEMATLKEIGKWKDRWFIFPFPNMSEPVKAVCYLTNTSKKGFDYDDEHMARLHLKASLHAVDRFFALVRRNLSLLERPIATASSGRRMWYGTNPYNPGQVALLLDIFRVWYNYVETGADGKTPAMRLKMAKKPYTEDEILRYWPSLSGQLRTIRATRHHKKDPSLDDTDDTAGDDLT